MMNQPKKICLEDALTKFKLVNGRLHQLNELELWQEATGTNNGRYRAVYVKGNTYLMHRVVWALHTGKEIFGQIDHIDGDPENNCVTNLREVTNRENAQNWERHRQGKAVGASFVTALGVWQVSLMLQKKLHYLGQFSTEEQSAEAYQKAIELENQFTDIKSFRRLVKESVSFDAFCTVVTKNSNKFHDPKKYLDFDKNRQKWRVQMPLGGKNVCVGRFTSKEEAMLYRDAAARLKSQYVDNKQFRQLVQQHVTKNLFFS